MLITLQVFHPDSNWARLALPFSAFCKWGNRIPERWSHLSKVTQHISRTRLWKQPSWLQSHWAPQTSHSEAHDLAADWRSYMEILSRWSPSHRREGTRVTPLVLKDSYQNSASVVGSPGDFLLQEVLFSCPGLREAVVFAYGHPAIMGQTRTLWLPPSKYVLCSIFGSFGGT
jgi:hypothetical protein